MPDFSNFNPLQIVWDDGLGPVAVEEIAPTQWQLLHPFSYTTKAGKTITVPAGFITDGASSPLRLFITSWGGKYSTAAVIHDYLYKCLDKGIPDPAAPIRKDADDILLEIMTECKVDFYIRWIIWIAIRAFGARSITSGVK